MGSFARKLVLAVPLAAVWVAFSWLPRADFFFVRIFLGTLQTLIGLLTLNILAFQRSVPVWREGIITRRLRGWVFSDAPELYRLTPPELTRSWCLVSGLSSCGSRMVNLTRNVTTKGRRSTKNTKTIFRDYVLVKLRLPDSQLVTGGLYRGKIGVFIGRVFYDEQNIDDGLRRQPGH